MLEWEYDEGTFMLGAHLVQRGLRPFVDFAVHQPPLHLYELALSGQVFGQTVFGYRMLSVLSVAASGVLLFALMRPAVGPLPALVGEAVFLFSPAQIHALNAVAEPAMLVLMLLGAALLFLGTRPRSAYAGGIVFVAALLTKPTCLVFVVAVAASLAYARAWSRLRDLVVSGVLAGIAGLAWLFVLSDGVFADIVRYTAQRVGTRTAGLWSFDSGFREMRQLLDIDTRMEWTIFCFKNFWMFPAFHLPLALFAVAFAGIPCWIRGCARSRPALAAFAVLWPVSSILTNFVILDYVSAKYFLPFLAFTAFLVGGILWRLERHLPPVVATGGGIAACVALAAWFASGLGPHLDPWYFERSDWLAREHPQVTSFTPMFFAATQTEPGCGMWNPPDTYGEFGEAVLGSSERLRRLRISDQQFVDCLREHPEMKVVVDFWYYFFTRPGHRVREYLSGEGRDRVVFFSPQALAQWEHPYIVQSFIHR